MDVLITVLSHYAMLVAIIGLGCVILTVFSISLGVRGNYLDFLSLLFHWTKEWHSTERKLSVDDTATEDERTEDISSRALNDEILRQLALGADAIAKDLFTESQKLGELPGWNLLTRTDSGLAWTNPRLTLLWICGFLVRWIIFLPVRLVITIFAMAFLLTASVCVGLLPEGRLKCFLDRRMNAIFFRLLGRSASLSVTYVNPENIPRDGSICVANHTSPFDIVVLANHRNYSLVGQKHVGFLGTCEKALLKVSQHIWFDRFQSKDREFTRKRLEEHAKSGKPPIMVFPEGVCVNNTTILKFRKGVFEIDVPIHPVSIKYDRRYGDAFWVQDTWATHHISLLTCWAIRAEVTYLPPMRRETGEDAIQFAMRVKRVIADAGGLKSLEWDGTLKYLPVGNKQKEASQVECAARLRQRMYL